MGYRIDNAKCTAATDKAVQIEAEIFDAPMWIPQSQIDDDSEVYQKGDKGTLIISDWWAEKQGWSD